MFQASRLSQYKANKKEIKNKIKKKKIRNEKRRIKKVENKQELLPYKINDFRAFEKKLWLENFLSISWAEGQKVLKKFSMKLTSNFVGKMLLKKL